MIPEQIRPHAVPHTVPHTVIVAAHGPDRGSADPTRHLAGMLAETLARRAGQGVLQVRPAFLRGTGPDLLPDVLAALPAGRPVTVLPHFAADGTFTRSIIPARIREAGSHLTVTALPPLGTAPAIHDLLATALRAQPGSDLLLIGHGSTDQNSPSPLTALAESLRAAGHTRRAAAVFLEHAPRLQDWRALGLGPDIVIAGLFAGYGRHVRQDLPAAFGLPEDSVRHHSSHRIAGYHLTCLLPLTDAAAMAGIAADLLAAT